TMPAPPPYTLLSSLAILSNAPPPTHLYTLSLHDALPISRVKMYTGDDFNYAELIAGDDKGFSHALLGIFDAIAPAASYALSRLRSEEHTSELQSRFDLVCRLLLEKKKKQRTRDVDSSASA